MKRNLIKKEDCLKGILVVVLYLLLPSFLSIPFLFFNIKKSILYLVVYFLSTIIFLFLYKNDLKNDWSNLKNDFLKNIKHSLFYWFIGCSIMIITTHLLDFFSIPLINQEENIALFKEIPFTETIILIFFTPIMEELAFRKSFNSSFSSRSIYLIVTSSLFAFLHIASSLNNLLSWLYLIPYMTLGLTLGFTYKKTNNIFYSIFLHAFHNIITLIDIFILGGLL